MTKRKHRNTTIGRVQKNSKLRRRDTDCDENINVNNSNSILNTDNRAPTEINFSNSNKVEETPQSQFSDQPNIQASSTGRNQLDIYEDENFLDYEPFEDEVDNNYSGKNSVKDGQHKLTDELIDHIDVPETCGQNNNLLERNCSTFIPCSFYNDIGDSKNGSIFDDEASKSDCDMHFQKAEVLEQDLNLNDQTETNTKNQVPEKEPNKYSFGNAQVKFNGPLNITITRSLSKNKESDQNLSGLEQNSLCDSAKIKVYDITTLESEENWNMERKKWFRTISSDFSNNVNCLNSKQADEMSFGQLKSLDNLCKEEKNQHTSLSSHNSFNSYFENNLIEPVIERYKPENTFVRNKGNAKQSEGSVEENRSTPYIRDEFQVQENYKEEFVTKWLMQTGEDSFQELLESLCESHFTTSCNDIRCSKSHSLENIKKTIQESNSQELNKLYKIALKKDLWFMLSFDIFLESFTVPPNVDKIMLIDMIDDVYKVFNGTFTDKTSYVVKVVESLNTIGISFKQAIEHIILRYGTSQLWICDILLFLIAKKSNLDDHWCLVQKIICCRREKIDPDVVTELLVASSKNSPRSKELHKKIYEDIFEKDLVDLSKIPRHLREMIGELDGNHNLIQGDEYPLGIPAQNSWQFSNNLDPEEDEISIRSFSEASNSQDRLISIPKCWTPSSSSCGSQIGEDTDPIPQKTFAQHLPEEKIELNVCKIDKTQRCSESRSSHRISEKVLRKVVESRCSTPKTETPANVIAHPACQPVIDPSYQCNVSLHNLLPEVDGWITAISACDLRRLRKSVVDVDIVEFLDVLNSYRDQYTIENIIVTLLTLLKSMGAISAVYSKFISLLDALQEKDPKYMNKIHLKISIEVLALNLIYLFNSKGRWYFSRNILLKVRDWHSLVTSKIFVSKSKQDSHMGRYIYLIKVLLSADDFFWVNEIFQAEVLNLLGPASTWPFKHKNSDTKDRNEVLQFFFEKGFPQNIFIANDLLKSITIAYGGSVEGFNVWMWFDDKIVSLMKEGDSNKSVLLLLFNDITNHYERYMDKFVLQAYMLHMQDCIKSEDALKLFKICCNKGLYPEYMGDEDLLYVTTDLTDFEIMSLLHCYFSNASSRHVPPHNFCIELLLPETKASKLIEEKYRKNRNVYKVFECICIILESKYNIVIKQPIHSRIHVPFQRVAETQMYKKKFC